MMVRWNIASQTIIPWQVIIFVSEHAIKGLTLSARKIVQRWSASSASYDFFVSVLPLFGLQIQPTHQPYLKFSDIKVIILWPLELSVPVHFQSIKSMQAWVQTRVLLTFQSQVQILPSQVWKMLIYNSYCRWLESWWGLHSSESIIFSEVCYIMWYN